MAQINKVIPQQNFELVRDRIGLILADELNVQHGLTNGETLNPTVFIEHFLDFDKEEMPVINVSLNTISFSNKNPLNVDGSTVYTVDVYVAAPFEDNRRGDFVATQLLHRLVGMCRAILENPVYRTLSFQPGFIGGSMVNNIEIPEVTDTKDAFCKAQARITFSVKMTENVTLVERTKIEAAQTTVALYNTEEGYRYERIFYTKLNLLDSWLLPNTDISLHAIRFDDRIIYVEKVFAFTEEISPWLNDNLVKNNSLEGSFLYVPDSGIFYRNIEKFQIIEVMAIYKPGVIYFKIGDPDDEINDDGKTVEQLDNGDPIASPLLQDATVEAVFIGVGENAVRNDSWSQLNDGIEGIAVTDDWVIACYRQNAPERNKLADPVISVGTIAGSIVPLSWAGVGAESYELRLLIVQDANTVINVNNASEIYRGTGTHLDYVSTNLNKRHIFYLIAHASGFVSSNAVPLSITISNWYYPTNS